MRARCRQLNYSNVISTLALAVALTGGVAWAAATIGPQDIKRNAVRAKHIHPGQVRSAEIRDGAVRSAEFAALNGTLRRGQTIRGTWGISGNKVDQSATALNSEAEISFGFALASAPAPHFIGTEGPSPPECPGTADNPRALAGHLCAYAGEALRAGTPLFIDPTTGGFNGTSRYGATLRFAATAGNGQAFRAVGTWAVTAP